MLAALFRTAHVGYVTPLRDGMNLVAKEYVSAQDPENQGVLVLSRFAGAAQELDGALIVNPLDIDGMADALADGARDAARGAPGASSRHDGAIAGEHNVSVWRDNFMRDLQSANGASPHQQAHGRAYLAGKDRARDSGELAAGRDAQRSQ